MDDPGRISLERIERAPALLSPEFRDSPQYECEPLSAARLEAARLAQARGARLVVDSLDIETVEGAGTIGNGSELRLVFKR